MTSIDTSFRIAELLASGLKCSHVLMLLALEARGESDPRLVKAMSGLALGLGQGFNCGCLTAGCAVIGLYAGRADAADDEDPRCAAAIDDFSGWFHAMAKDAWGGIDCADIMQFDEALQAQRCPTLIASVWDRLEATLADHGIDPALSDAAEEA
ncbi:MAG: C-GCAxxG-C-C family protein [Ancalomicrobiaceae bacterium]|nr:C-GCAxxG-C-C family protein [Ancalomicrobiaceae bacterium]